MGKSAWDRVQDISPCGLSRYLLPVETWTSITSPDNDV